MVDNQDDRLNTDSPLVKKAMTKFVDRICPKEGKPIMPIRHTILQTIENIGRYRLDLSIGELLTFIHEEEFPTQNWSDISDEELLKTLTEMDRTKLHIPKEWHQKHFPKDTLEDFKTLYKIEEDSYGRKRVED